MRDIKFRAWDNNEEWMVDDMLLSFDGEILTDDVQPHDTPYKEIELADEGRYELMQYTGMKDVKGDEIYEGDIVHDDEFIYLVGFGVFTDDNDFQEPTQGQTGFYIVDIHTDETFPFYSMRYRVIGNIYENPELLEE